MSGGAVLRRLNGLAGLLLCPLGAELGLGGTWELHDQGTGGATEWFLCCVPEAEAKLCELAAFLAQWGHDKSTARAGPVIASGWVR